MGSSTRINGEARTVSHTRRQVEEDTPLLHNVTEMTPGCALLGLLTLDEEPGNAFDTPEAIKQLLSAVSSVRYVFFFRFPTFVLKSPFVEVRVSHPLRFSSLLLSQ